jgi:predicted kinase
VKPVENRPRATQDAVAPVLVVFGGRPGSGKTAISRPVADALGATYLRIDAIETALARVGVPIADSPAAYAVGNVLAADQLRAGRPVVVDAVNPVAVARQGWTELAAGLGARLLFVEVRCPDPAEHRRRVEQRRPDLPGQVVPGWADVTGQTYEPWTEPRLELENAGAVEDAVARVLAWLR